jgi:hypothetical protein
VRARAAAILLGAFCALLSGSAADATAAPAPAPAPRAALMQARSTIDALAHQTSSGSVQTLAAAAARALSTASAPSLWIDARHAAAPSYGDRVFGNSVAGLADLQRLKRFSLRSVPGAIRLVVGADRQLAVGAIAQARGGSGETLVAANHELAAGDREDATGRLAAAVHSYAKAWERAFNALAELVAGEATTVPSSALAAAAQEALGSRKIALAGPTLHPSQPLLMLDGKPEIFFAGSEACPFCAVQRWGMIVALGQFGTFSNLHLMQSATTEPPVVSSFTFFGSSYESPYISFVPVEVVSNVPHGYGFAHLQRLSPFERALLGRFDPPQQTPFIDVANRFTRIDSTVQPGLVAGMSWTQIVGSLRRPASVPAQAIAGEAEVLTAELCEATNGNPDSVCSAPIVKQYEAALPLLNGRGGGCPITAMRTAATGERAQPPPAGVARCRTG